jgi:formylglycine-generating enzyme required for sulfatase activity
MGARGARSGERPVPLGNEPPLDASRANYGVGHLTPVGLFPKGNTTEGLRDMLGNVWEWCGDWYGAWYDGSYRSSIPENPSGPKGGDSKVMRGGSWLADPQNVRVSSRNRYEPSFRADIVGFRCASELP